MENDLLILQKSYAAGRMAWPEIRQRVQCWLAHARHADAYRLSLKLLSHAAFRRTGVSHE